jgi:hypothetical protein
MQRIYRIVLVLAGFAVAGGAHAEGQTAQGPSPTTYWTEVALGSSTCDNVTIKPGPTEIVRLPGDSLSVSHAGQTYRGSITREGNFTTTPKELVFGTTVYTIGITGRLLEKELTAVVTVSVREQGAAECRYTVNWTGRT